MRVRDIFRSKTRIFFCFFLSPIISIFSCIAFIKILIQSRVLLIGKWSQYFGFEKLNALNSLFYKTQLINIEKYGLSGISRYLGYGNYRLEKWWHLSLLSSYIYSNAISVTLLLSTITIIIEYIVICFFSIDTNYVKFLLPIFSSLFIITFIKNQNYNILGWVIFPVFLYALNADSNLILLISTLLISMLSITTLILILPLVLIKSIYNHSVHQIFYVLPSLLYLLFFKIKLLNFPVGFNKKNIVWVANLFGAKSFKRKNLTTFHLGEIYQFSFILIGFLFLDFQSEVYRMYYLWVIVIYIFNSKIIKISDIENILSLYLLLIFSYAMSTTLHFTDLLIIIFITNPSPRALSSGSYLSIDPLKPIKLEKLFDELNAFILLLKPDSKILVLYKNPNNIYENIFDGKRILVEPLSYISNLNNIRVLPDWWAVFDSAEKNKKKSFWISNPTEIKNLLKKLGFSYFIAFHEDHIRYIKNEKKSFRILKSFKWSRFLNDRPSNLLYQDLSNTTWYLCEVKK